MTHDPDLFRAGGFIATADEIVQHFSLPRSQYFRPKDRAPSPSASVDDVEMVPDSEGVMDEELPAPNKRDSTTIIQSERWYKDEGVKVHSETEELKGSMKTMAELAAEHAERERQLGQGPTRGSKPSRRIVKSPRARQNLLNDESEDEPSVDGDEDLSEPLLTDELSDPSPPRRAASSKAPSRTKTRSPSKFTQKKKRPRSLGVDQGSDVEYNGSPGSKTTSTTGRRPRRTTTAKAGKLGPKAVRTVSGSSATSVVVPASDRVLRSRKVRV